LFAVVVTELLGLNSSVTVFDAEVFTSQESIKAVIRSAFANRRRAFLIIGTAADYHQFLSIAACVVPWLGSSLFWF
jgi:hypothetical protein